MSLTTLITCFLFLVDCSGLKKEANIVLVQRKNIQYSLKDSMRVLKKIVFQVAAVMEGHPASQGQSK